MYLPKFIRKGILNKKQYYMKGDYGSIESVTITEFLKIARLHRKLKSILYLDKECKIIHLTLDGCMKKEWKFVGAANIGAVAADCKSVPFAVKIEGSIPSPTPILWKVIIMIKYLKGLILNFDFALFALLWVLITFDPKATLVQYIAMGIVSIALLLLYTLHFFGILKEPNSDDVWKSRWIWWR
jgi:hypothetical protein